MDIFKPVSSSSIEAYSYDANTMELNVVFKTGVKYSYKQVPPDIMSQVFDQSKSVGSMFHRLIYSRYEGTKVKQ